MIAMLAGKRKEVLRPGTGLAAPDFGSDSSVVGVSWTSQRSLQRGFRLKGRFVRPNQRLHTYPATDIPVEPTQNPAVCENDNFPAEDARGCTTAVTMRQIALCYDGYIAPDRIAKRRRQTVFAAKSTEAFVCDGCHAERRGRCKYLQGWRWMCTVCADVDFCTRCALHTSHDPSHALVSAVPPGSQQVPEEFRGLPSGSTFGRLGVAREQISCGGCFQAIVGNRFRCAVCPQYDLCQECFCAGVLGREEEAGIHDEQTHAWLLVKTPLQETPSSSGSHVSPSARAFPAGDHGAAEGLLKLLGRRREEIQQHCPSFSRDVEGVACGGLLAHTQQQLAVQLDVLKRFESGPRRQSEFRRLLREWHPDKNASRHELATAVFQWLQGRKREFCA